MKFKPLRNDGWWTLVRAATTVMGLVAIGYVGWQQFQSSYAQEIAKIARYDWCNYPGSPEPLCEPALAFVWMETFFAVLIAAVVYAAIVGIVYSLAVYIRRPHRCRGCHCKDHKRQQLLDVSAATGSLVSLALMISVLSMMITTLAVTMR